MSRGRKNHINYGAIGRLKITAHAHGQMKSRSITKKEVKNAIGTGEMIEGNEPGTTHITSPDGLLVIVSFEENLIITVVRANQQIEKEHPFRSRLENYLIPEAMNEEEKTPSKQNQEEKDEISIEDYLSGNYRKS